MSRKRQATGGDQLTGGTRDVNPQYLHGAVTLSAANTTTSATLGTPIVRVGPQTDGQAIIMEIIKIYADLANADNLAPAAGVTAYSQSLYFSTVSGGTTAQTWDDPRVFAAFKHSTLVAFTAAGTGMLDDTMELHEFDCTDGAGHGLLIATDNIFIQGQSINMTAAGTFRFKILYRFKRVSLVEYIGIVQSQQ